MFALGPQLQARWRNPLTAQRMHYQRNKTREEQSRDQNSGEYIYDNIFCGSGYLEAFKNSDIRDKDMVVVLSIDGAQLIHSKQSNCWMYVWLLLDLVPDKQYKICNILPGGIIPGLGHPKNIDSFLFPG